VEIRRHRRQRIAKKHYEHLRTLRVVGLLA
jgi:hypothetical protein